MKTLSSITYLQQPENIGSEIDLSPYTQLFILVDENTRACCLPKVLNQPAFQQAQILEIPAGENFKTLDTCEKIWQQLLEQNADRNTLLVNLGGGVISDMGGFIASLYKRGIDFINIPTTLLAMVDATVGGKTGVDFFGIKNSIGVFSLPKHIFICPEFLKTLPPKELLSGYAEVVKHGLIHSNSDYLNEVLSFNVSQSNTEQWLAIIQQSIQIKSAIVENDFQEKGFRKVLNLGHTIGHAIESYALAKEQPLPHGFAVAYGLICALHLSQQYFQLSAAFAENITHFLLKYYSAKPKLKLNYKNLKPYLLHDKKNKTGEMRFVLLQQPGQPVFDIACNEQDVKKAIQYLAEIL